MRENYVGLANCHYRFRLGKARFLKTTYSSYCPRCFLFAIRLNSTRKLRLRCTLYTRWELYTKQRLQKQGSVIFPFECPLCFVPLLCGQQKK
jgi:hypothetical protein